MANRLEMAKYNAVLQNPAAKERFQTLTSQVRLLALSHNIKATDGELMAVCAYLAGREFAGSTATKDTCILLGCMSDKTFDRVHDFVQNVLKSNHAPRAPTIYSLAQKYALRSEHLQAVHAVQSVLYTSIPKELQDERVVCGIFALICKLLDYDPDPWVKAEARLHEIEDEEMATMIVRVTKVHGDQIKSTIQSYQEPGRLRRQHVSPIKKPVFPTPTPSKSGTLTLKRQAPESSSPRQPPAKRRKAEPVARATSPVSSAPSSRRSASSVPPTQVTSSHHSNSSVLDLLEDEDNDSLHEESDGKAFSEPLESRSISPAELDFGEESIQIPESLDDLDWKTLSQLRLRAITRKLKDTTSLHRIMPRTPFADRDLWEVNT